MAIISATDLKTIFLDPGARWAAEAGGEILASAIATGGVYTETSPNAGLAVANTNALTDLRDDTQALTDPEQLDDLFDAANDLFDSPPQLGSWASSNWSRVLDALDAHCRRYGYANLDAYLTFLNLSAITARAHELWAKYLGRVSAANVFTGKPYVLGSIACSGATAGTLTLSGYNSTGLLDTTRFGAGQIAIRNTKGGGEGGSAVVLTLMALKSGAAASKAFTTGAATLDELTAEASDTTQTFTGLSGTGGAAGAGGCALVSIANATNGDTYDVVILPDRCVNAAA